MELLPDPLPLTQGHLRVRLPGPDTEEVRSVLTTRREPVAPVWVVGHSPDWSKTSAGAFLGGSKKEEVRRLAALRTFGLHPGLGKAIIAYATGYAATRRSLPLGGAGVTEAFAQRVLVVDDDPGMRETLQDILAAEGIAALTAGTGALAVIDRGPRASGEEPETDRGHAQIQKPA